MDYRGFGWIEGIMCGLEGNMVELEGRMGGLKGWKGARVEGWKGVLGGWTIG